MLIRGLNVVVLNEVTGAVMSSRWYDTYESEADSGLLVKYLKGLRQGRIVCFAVKVRLIKLLIFVQYFHLQNKHFLKLPGLVEKTSASLRSFSISHFRLVVVFFFTSVSKRSLVQFHMEMSFSRHDHCLANQTHFRMKG